MSRRPLAVAVFNDSATMRHAIRAALRRDPAVRIVAERANGTDAADVVARSGADVAVMDVVMPGIDGYQATRDIMSRHPTPIVMVSSVVDPRDRDVILEALAAGALHIVEPPPSPGAPDYERQCAAFVELLRTIAGAHLERAVQETVSAPPPTPAPVPRRTAIDVIGVVSSAGGPQALLELLAELPREVMPPILLVQHIAHGFGASFADWLRQTSGYPVAVASHGTMALAGHLYTAPDDHHLWMERDGRLALSDGSADERRGFRPSGDVLLQRLAAFGPRAVGVILSGMGSDGALGGAVLVRSGGRLVAQSDPVIDGMPGAAYATGSVEERLPVAAIGRWLRERSGLT